MALLPATAPTPRPAEPALPGTWKLAPGRAITLEPREDGVLKVAHGQLWATWDGPHGGQGRGSESGDHFIGVGERVPLRAGQRMVVEAWNDGAPAYFSWDPLPQLQVVRQPVFAAVMQPLADLRLAIIFGGRAIGGIATGLVQVAWGLAFGRRASFEERACTRHGVPG